MDEAMWTNGAPCRFAVTGQITSQLLSEWSDSEADFCISDISRWCIAFIKWKITGVCHSYGTCTGFIKHAVRKSKTLA